MPSGGVNARGGEGTDFGLVQDAVTNEIDNTRVLGGELANADTIIASNQDHGFAYDAGSNV